MHVSQIKVEVITYSHVPPLGGEFGSNGGDGYGKPGVVGGSTVGGVPLPPLPPGPPLPPLPPLPPFPPLPPPLGGGL